MVTREQICKVHNISDSQLFLLLNSWEWCDKEDKSTEFMLQYMADVSGISYDAVVEFVTDSKVGEYYQNH